MLHPARRGLRAPPWSRLVVALVVAAEFSAAAQRNPAPARLAVVVESPALSAAGDVLTAALSKHPELHLLERAEIDKVYREQALSAGNSDYLRLGNILGADGLILLSLNALTNGRVLATRIVAAKPGVVIGAVYEKFPPGDIEAWSGLLAGKIMALRPKLHVSASDAIPVSVLNFRSALASREGREVERELTWLMIHRLANEPRLFVLERARMETLAFEKQIAGDLESAFWASRVVVDGEIVETSTNRLSVTLHLERPVRPAQPLQITGSRNDIRALADSLAAALVRQIKPAGSALLWEPVREGERFYQEAKSASQAGLLDQALAAAEASQILGFESRPQRVLMADLYAHKAIRFPERTAVRAVPAGDVDLESALRGLGVYEPLLENTAALSGRVRGDILQLGTSVLRSGSRVVRWHWENGRYEDHREDLDRLRRQLRHTAERLASEGKNEASIGEFYCVAAAYAPYWYDDPEETLRAYEKVLAARFTAFADPLILPRIRHTLAQYREKPFGTNDSAWGTPWLIDWQGGGQRDLKDRWRRFLQQLARSADFNQRLDGWLLAFYSSDAQDERSHALESAKADLWANRAAVGTNEQTHAIATQVLQGLPFDEDFRFGMFNHFLQESVVCGYDFCRACYGTDFTNRAHAMALYDSMRAFEYRLWPAGQKLDRRYDSFRSVQEQLIKAWPELRTQAAGGLQVTQCWPPVERGPEYERRFWPQEVLYAAGAVWVLADNFPQGLSHDRYPSFTRVEIPSLDAKTWQGPARYPRATNGALVDFSHTFVVADGWLFWVRDNRLLRCTLASNTWDEIEVPACRYPMLRFTGGRLYYAFPTTSRFWAYTADASGILRIDPRTLQSELIASSRRKPGQGCLDDVTPYLVYDLFAGPDRNLYASVRSTRINNAVATLCRYADRRWVPVQDQTLVYRAVPFAGGNLLQPVGRHIDDTVMLYDNGRLDRLFPSPWNPAQSTDWRWPSQPGLWQNAPVNPIVGTANGDDLWLLGPRLRTEAAPLNLYYFSRKESEPLRIALNFPGADTEKYNTTHYSTAVGLVLTPSGLVISGTGDTAFWFLPQAALEPLIGPRQVGSKDSPQPVVSLDGVTQ